jgi:uncharacterized protein
LGWAKFLFGEMADELLLTSAKVKPDKLLQSGYSFKDSPLEVALKKLLSNDIENKNQLFN